MQEGSAQPPSEEGEIEKTSKAEAPKKEQEKRRVEKKGTSGEKLPPKVVRPQESRQQATKTAGEPQQILYEEGKVTVFRKTDGTVLIEGVRDKSQEAIGAILQKAGLKDVSPSEVEVRGDIGGAENLPDPTVASAPLRRFINEIGREASRPDVARSIERLREIESELGKAVLEGRITDDPALIELTRNALEGLLSGKAELLEEAREEGRLQQLGFGKDLKEDYQETKQIFEKLVRASRGSTDFHRKLGELQAKIRKVEAEDKKIPKFREVKKAEDLPTNFRTVFEVTRAIEEAVGFYGQDTVEELLGRAVADRFLTQNSEVSYYLRLDNYFRNRFNNLTEVEQIALAGDIKTKAEGALQYILSFGSDPAGYLKEIHDLVKKEEGGFREWMALSQIYHMERAIRVHRLVSEPTDWRDVPERVSNTLIRAEATGLSIESLQPTIQLAYRLLERIAPTTQEGRDLYEKIKSELEAFKFKHALKITADQTSMDPEALTKIFSDYMKGDLETTFADFARRYERDQRGRGFAFSKNIDGQELSVLEKANVFDIAHRLYSYRLRDDRMRMNMVEEMTKYSISHPFDRDTITQIRAACGLGDDRQFPSGWDRESWVIELEGLRQDLYERMQRRVEEINKKAKDKSEEVTVDDIWGQSKIIRGIDSLKNIFYGTKAAINEWYMKKTLHGAFGYVEESDLGELASEFNLDIDEARKRFLGKQFLDLRRGEMLDRLEQELRSRGLKVNFGQFDPSGTADFRDADVSQLRESGFLGSVEKNAFDLAWIFQWSGYDFIRIYGRGKSRYDDDFKALVSQHSSNLYFAKIEDHTWEFYHQDFENRGRTLADETNIVWKQFFPGKHHHLYPHVTMMGRFMNNFMSESQQDLVYEKVQEFKRQHPEFRSQNEGEFNMWVRGLVIRDLIEAGTLSFGDKDFSVASRNRGDDFGMTKFNLIDNSIDRGKLKNFIAPPNLQGFLEDPTEEKFMALLDRSKVFASTRLARMFPWAHFALRAHWEVAHKYTQKIFNRENIGAAEFESFVRKLIGKGDVERKNGEEFIRRELGLSKIRIGGNFFRGKYFWVPKVVEIQLPKVFGTAPFRATRQTYEFIAAMISKTRLGFLLDSILDFFRTLFKYSTSTR